MSFESLLIDTCTVERYTEGAQDSYGNPALTWASHLADESCRLVTGGGRELKVGAEIVVADYKLFLDDVDITEQDRVVVSSITYEILLVERRKDGAGGHHRECLLRISR